MPEVFKCPSCSAPLEFEGKTMQRCRFCGSNIIVPSDVFQKSDKNMFDDASALGSKAVKLAEIYKEIGRGNKINAIKIFHETFGCGLKEAKDAVDALERGESVDISGMQIRTTNLSNNPQNIEAVKKVGFAIGGTVLAMTILIPLISLGAIATIFYFVSNSIEKTIERTENVKNISTPATKNPMVLPTSQQENSEPQVAREILKFGGEGIGAGKFKDNRSLAVGADGQIYSADFTGGRIQTFDKDGNFQTQIMVAADRAINDIEVDRKGVLFVLQTYDLSRFDTKSGEFLGKSKLDYASDLTIGLDGKLYVSTRKGVIYVLNSDGTKIKTIQIGKDVSLENIQNLAIDGKGNFYALDNQTYSVFKFSPDGKFLTRFGGKSNESFDKTPKNLFQGSPFSLAIDSKGRVFVSQISRISIFDENGNFLNDFKSTQSFAIAFNDADELFVASRPFVVKYKLSE